MKSLNRVFLMGHLGHTPELQISKEGKPYARLAVATHRAWMSPEEQRQEATDWHSVFVWGAQAERCVHSLKKGAAVFIEGSLTYWAVAKESGKDYKSAIQAQSVHFLSDSRPSESSAETEILDNLTTPRNHNAVAHPA